MQFASVTVTCGTAGCPNADLGEVGYWVEINENGDLCQLVCGVCQQDLIPNPDAE
jgi:hypothetical protein